MYSKRAWCKLELIYVVNMEILSSSSNLSHLNGELFVTKHYFTLAKYRICEERLKLLPRFTVWSGSHCTRLHQHQGVKYCNAFTVPRLRVMLSVVLHTHGARSAAIAGEAIVCGKKKRGQEPTHALRFRKSSTAIFFFLQAILFPLTFFPNHGTTDASAASQDRRRNSTWSRSGGCRSKRPRSSP